MTETSAESDERPTPEEVTDSLTGFDEIAIEKAFGKPMDELGGTMPGRALVFVLIRREGSSDSDSFAAVMALSMRDVENRFAEDEVVLEGDDPVTPQGEDGPGGTMPTGSLPPGA